MSSKAQLLFRLRENQGVPVSGNVLAHEMGISRVAVWKAVQALLEAGYAIETKDTGYLFSPNNEKDFLYPWEFGENEGNFHHYLSTTNTMDRARELALRGADSGTVITADRQTAGKCRNGRTWISRSGGLYFSILERPRLTIADYPLFSLVLQIAVVKTISSVCGKTAYLRWPNDIYINNRKIAAITTEVSGEGDLLTWLIGGIGINVNNKGPTIKAISCAEIIKRQTSRKEILCKILEEFETTKKIIYSTAIYSQGSSALAAEWNSLTDSIGAKAAVFEPKNKENDSNKEPVEILKRGIFKGIDPLGRCILETKDETLVFNQGSVSLQLAI
ncbi:MAG: biotin--[acetyl-CoA-carboxylase] ligase [Treponema sp.]|jgi:BirA family biotin operon repressor/biotin-[acetyl-CoA-carboxylase] ligase|nr:biotin--[acetyl-CoA-carboxylase] ligase [Treponema sp.]